MLSVVIPTTREINKPELDCEILIQKEKGLVTARNTGFYRSSSDVVAFIDDDVIVDKVWAKQIEEPFKDPQVGCVIGKVILEGNENRDNDWSNPIMKKFFNKIGAVEACNMAFSREVFSKVGGFDPVYDLGVGEWSEPDLVNKIKQSGYKVIHSQATLIHRPSQEGCYQDRSKYSYQRMKNFHVFRRRWLKWDINLVLVVSIFYLYWVYKFIKTGNPKWLGGLLALR